MPEEEENAAARLSEDYIWRMVIGKKIVCSECGVHTPKWFEFSLTLVGPKAFRPKAFVHVKCTKCGHEGDYNPTNEEVSQYEFNEKVALDQQAVENYGPGAITNVDVESVYRRGRIENNDALEA